MALILCLETATTTCSVALARGEEILALREDNSPGYSHAEQLHVFIAQVLAQAGLKVTDLDAVAVSKGPGSYTGLRIGVSAAKGLCFAADLKLISIPTLELLALQARSENGLVVPMLDARRMEVYAAVYTASGELVKPVSAVILDEQAFKKELQSGPVRFVGSGAGKFKALVDSPNASFFPEVYPSARHMPHIALSRYKKGDIEDVAYFEPFYLKDFIAG